MTPTANFDRWYYAQGKKKMGPVPVAELRRLLATGALKPEDMVLQEGTPKWRPLAEVAGAKHRPTRIGVRWKLALGGGVGLVSLALLGWVVLAVLHGPNGNKNAVESEAVAHVPGNAGQLTIGMDETPKDSSLQGNQGRPPQAAGPGPATEIAREADALLATKEQPRIVVQMGHTSPVTSVAYSPDGKQVLTGSADKTARLWDVKSGKEIYTFEHLNGVASVAFSPDGTQVLTGSWNKTARLWGVESGKEIHAFTGDFGLVTLVAISPEGELVLTDSGDKTARLWDLKSGKALLAFSGHTDQVTSIAFSPDGKQVLTGSKDKTARLWDLKSGKALLAFSGHTDQVTSIAFSPDGKQVLTGSRDKTARLWDGQTAKQLQVLPWYSEIISVAYSPDGNHVLTGSERSEAQSGSGAVVEREEWQGNPLLH